jgi:hypothetical protein
MLYGGGVQAVLIKSGVYICRAIIRLILIRQRL